MEMLQKEMSFVGYDVGTDGAIWVGEVVPASPDDSSRSKVTQKGVDFFVLFCTHLM